MSGALTLPSTSSAHWQAPTGNIDMRVRTNRGTVTGTTMRIMRFTAAVALRARAELEAMSASLSDEATGMHARTRTLHARALRGGATTGMTRTRNLKPASERQHKGCQ